MKRFASVVVVIGVAAAGVIALAGGATAASSSSTLPTLNIALSGTKGVSVSGSMVSGAVNVVSTHSGAGMGDVGLIRVNPAVPPSTALAQGQAAVNAHHGDLNALTALGDAVILDAPAPSSVQTVLTPGTWVAVNLSGMGQPGLQPFNVSSSSSPASLPAPGGKVSAIEFGFHGASTLRDGELVRFEDDGFLVHMVVGIRVKNLAVARVETTALEAGKDKLARKLASGIANFAGPLSPGGMQQEVITAKPGIYVLACFMNSQDGREHTQLGMERTIKIVK